MGEKQIPISLQFKYSNCDKIHPLDQTLKRCSNSYKSVMSAWKWQDELALMTRWQCLLEVFLLESTFSPISLLLQLERLFQTTKQLL